MSASLVRKALDETTLGSEEKLGQLSKVSNKRFKPAKKTKKVSKEKVLKQNLKILRSLDYKVGQRSKGVTSLSAPQPVVEVEKDKDSLKKGKGKSKKEKSKKKQSDSVFTEEDFAQFEKEYFVTN